MSKKVRLNEDLREKLRYLMAECIKDAPEREKAWRAAHTTMWAAVKKCAKAKYPERDMKVLRKYNLTTQVYEISLLLQPGKGDNNYPRATQVQSYVNAYERNDMIKDKKKLDTIKLPKHVWQFPVDETTTKAVNDFMSLDAARSKNLEQLRTDVRLLIKNAKTLDEVEAVWPAAKRVRPDATPSNLPTMPLDAVLKRIKEAVANKNL
jgi:hypothetical protein